MSTPRFPLAITATITATLIGASSALAATSIGGQFLGRGASGHILAPAESAGVVPQTFWNPINSGDPNYADGSSDPLRDSAGNFTAVRIVYDCSDSWNSDGGTTTPDHKLMKGIIKANPE